MAFFSAIIIGHSQDLLRVISGFPGEGGFRYFIILFGVMVSLEVILQWFVGCSALIYMAALRWAVLLRVMLLFFIFFFVLERFPNMYSPLESFLVYFRKAPINPIHSGLDITV